MKPLILACILAILTAPLAQAGEADIVKVDVRQTGKRTYAFSVTVRHGDEGWNHYANAWEVLGPDGEILATRVLAHPHVNEQPFTRSLNGIEIPDGITEVTLRARDSQHGYGGETMTITLPGTSG